MIFKIYFCVDKKSHIYYTVINPPGGGVIVENKKLGRPKLKNPRKENINFRVTESELKEAQKVCVENDIRYVDIFLKGLEFWSRK